MGTLEKLKAYFGMIPADDYPDDERYHRSYDLDDYDERDAAPPSRTRAAYRLDDVDDMGAAVRGRGRRPVEPQVSGALAMERQPEPVTRLRVADQPAVSRDPLSRIVTLHPSGYPEARDVGEAFREGNPVIMNLTEMDNADAKRLVDFAAGLAFALRGSIDKVTNKVFLLSPSDADVSAEDRRRIAEGGLFLRR